MSSDLALAGGLDACIFSQCENVCGLSCGSLAEIASPGAGPACQACLQTNYCANTQECATNANCQTYLLCRQNCVTGDCVGACAGAGTSFFGIFWPIPAQCNGPCEVGSNWACAGHVQWPMTSFQARNLTVQLRDALTGDEQAGVDVKMCGGSDTTCPAPVSEEVTDSQGYVTLHDTLWNDQNLGLNGFLDIQGPTLYPTLSYWGFPLTVLDGTIAVPIPTFSIQDWNLIWSYGVAAPGVTLDPTLGVVFAVALDCFGNPAPGVAFSLSGPGVGTPPPKPLYPSGASPTIAISTTDTVTESSGTGIFINVQPGPVDVIATPAALGGPSSRVSVYVQAGTLTGVGLNPTPLPADGGESP
ncbi:MAG TPA: hypothetical protein VGL81_15080 [Polyangiaceae bacterium]